VCIHSLSSLLHRSCGLGIDSDAEFQASAHCSMRIPGRIGGGFRIGVVSPFGRVWSGPRTRVFGLWEQGELTYMR